jgi:hypothetical protein
MSLSRDTLLFGIALIVFGLWIEVSGMGGWPFAVTGLGFAVMGFLGSIASAARTAPGTRGQVDEDPS